MAGRAQPQPQLDGLARRDGHPVPECAPGAGPLGVDGGHAVDDVVVDAVLGVGGDRAGAVQPGRVGLVLAEQQLWLRTVGAGRSDELHGAEDGMLDGDRRLPRGPQGRLRLARIRIPGPGIAEPGRRQHVDGLGLRALIGELDGHQQVAWAGLGVAHLGDPVPVAVERAGVKQLVLGLITVPAGVGIDQVLIRKRALRIVVAPPVPGMTGDGVQVPPVLLHVLAVVALRASEPERPLLQDRVAPVPQRQGQAQPLLDVAEPGQPVLAPPVGTRPGVIMRQVVPCLTIRAVVLTHRPPLPLADVRPPLVPVAGLPEPVLQLAESRYPVTFGAHRAPFLRRCLPLPL